VRILPSFPKVSISCTNHSAAALAPIPIARSPAMSEHSLATDADGGIGRRMGQGVDAIAGSANKVLTGVVDTSFGMLRSFLPSSLPSTIAAVEQSPTSPRPGFGLLRRESGFSIAGISIGGAGYAGKSAEDGEKELTAVSRPGSVRSKKRSEYGGSEYEGTSQGEEASDSSEGEEDSDAEEEEEGGNTMVVGSATDTRSIRSFENMMSATRPKKKKAHTLPRLTLGDRLASMSGLKVIHIFLVILSSYTDCLVSALRWQDEQIPQDRRDLVHRRWKIYD
jgi:hypothetical protein